MSNVPKLRFKADDGSEFAEWEQRKFGEVFDRITTKNKENNQNVLTISAQQGLVNQEDYFKKSVAAQDVTGYYLLHKDDFAYNKSYSKGYPLGAIKRLTRYEKGVVSTLYICFRAKNCVTAFAEQFFESGGLNREIHKIAQEGARNHGLLNMSVVEFFKDIELALPRRKEQQKIAAFLTAVDTKIEQLTQKEVLLKQYKKGMMQKIFSQEIRFKANDGSEFPEWEEKRLADVLHEHKSRSKGSEEVFSVSVHKGLVNQVEHLGRSFAASDTSNYNLVKPNDIVYTKSPTGDFPYGIIKQSRVDKDVLVSPLYGVFTPESVGLGYMLHVYFESEINTHNYLHSIIQKGAKNTINITNTTFTSKSLKLPTSRDEQNKIGKLLSTIDTKIDQIAHQLDDAKTFKKGLLQQMFV